ncbi:hypothetical protein, partial [Staphylococcus aureus]
MCIRDRALAVSLFALSAGSYATVSYTHLRAHETLSDLVCRLLLEKIVHVSHIHISEPTRLR